MRLKETLARRPNSRAAAGVACCAALLLAGCGGEDASRVSGTVKLNGQPVGPGSLVFEPADLTSANAPSAVAQFGEDGKYSVRGPRNREETPPGDYIVTVQGGPPGTAGDENRDPGVETSIPERYRLRDNGIKVTVKPGDNTIDLNLEP
jgi:hypothetical protein